MIALILSAMATASPAREPASTGAFVARFDCQVNSKLDGEPLREKPLRQVVTIRSWKADSPVVVEVHYQGQSWNDKAWMRGVQVHDSGRFEASIDVGYGRFDLTQASDKGDSFIYSGRHMVMDAGPANDSGTCSSKIKKRPKKAAAAGAGK